MRWARNSRVFLLLAGLALVVVFLPGVGASGDATTTGNTLPDGGYLNLHFPDVSAAATLTQYSSEPPASINLVAGPQNISAGSSCSVAGITAGSPAGNPDLARFSSTPGTVGAEASGSKFVGLGVKSTGSSGTNCGRVEPGESLTVSLGAGLKLVDGTSPSTSLVATAAELDVDGKGSAVVRANLFAPGGTSPAGFALLSTAAPSGDSGPDSTSGDNFAFPMNAGMPACAGTQSSPTPPAAGQVCGKFAPFSSVTLSTGSRSSGTPSFALEGGRTTDPRSNFSWDSYKLRAQTADSVFRLQEATGVLDCGQSTGDVGGTGGTPTANVTRTSNDSSTCTPIAYVLQTSSNSDHLVTFKKDLTTQTDANFTITITWPPEDAPPPDDPSVPATLISYNGVDYHPEQWCGGTTTSPTLPSGEFYCLVTQSTQIVGGGKIQVTEKSFGKGDPNYKRS